MSLPAMLHALDWTALVMPCALAPKRSDDRVSLALDMHGEQQMMSAVLAVPPKESCGPKVSLYRSKGL